MTALKDRNIALVITGGIAAYKAAELARLYIKAEARVRAAMTDAAQKFITPLTFQTLTGHTAATSLWSENRPEIGHISLADWAHAVVVAPATANILAKISYGLADDFVSTFLLAVKAPILVCPSMNVNMFENPVVQENLERLRKRGVQVAAPGSGYLACGWTGTGRMAEPADIVEETRRLFTTGDLAGQRVLVTAGPTREAWDDIRYISNRSSGQMGLALAQSARRRGAVVTLITGPVAFGPPYGIQTVAVESTRDMLAAVQEHLPQNDVLIKAAAPGDFRPAARVRGKIKKGDTPPPIDLARNPDILKTVAPDKGHRIIVGFAAESENLIPSAKSKLQSKNMDLCVANQIGRPGEAFGSPTNRVWIVDRVGGVEEIPLADKEDVAGRILDRIADLIRQRKM